MGYRVLYLKDLQTPGEIPPTIPNHKQQQSRWACGSLRTARKILPLILLNRTINFKQRLQAIIHLTGYMIHPLMTISFVLVCISTIFNLNNLEVTHSLIFFKHHGISGSGLPFTFIFLQNVIWLFLVPLIIICTIAPWVSAVTTLRVQKLPLSQNLTSLLVLYLIGFGSSLDNTLGAGRALFSNRSWEWTRTPKYADLKSQTGWRTRKYQITSDRVWLLELAFAFLGALAISYAISHSNFYPLFILIPFTIAYAFISILTVLQS